MKKALLVLLAFFAVLPFVNADVLGPSNFLIAPSAVLWLFLVNMGANAVVIILFSKLFLKGFFAKLPTKKIIFILVGVTILGFIGDTIGFLTYLSLSQLGSGILTSLIIFVLDFFFFQFVIKTKTRQAFLVSLALGIITNPWLTFFGGVTFLFLIILLSPVLLLWVVFSIKKTDSTEKKLMDKFQNAILVVFIIAVFLFFASFIYFPAPKPEPLRSAQELIRDISLKPGSAGETVNVVFYPNSTLDRRSISVASNGLVNEEGVCVVPGDFAEEYDIWENSGTGVRVTYLGTSTRQVKIHAICDICSEIIKPNYFEEFDPQIKQEWVADNCTSSEFKAGNINTCCVLAIKKVY